MINIFFSTKMESLEKELQKIDINIFPSYSTKVDVVISKHSIPENYSSDKMYIILEASEGFGEFENVFNLTDASIEGLISLLGIIEKTNSDKKKLKQLRSIVKKERQLIKDAARYIEEMGGIDHRVANVFYKLLVFSNEVSRYQKLEDVSIKLNELLSEDMIISNISIGSMSTEADVCLMIENDLFLKANICESSGLSSFALMLVYDIVQSFYKREYKLKSQLDLWEAAFEKVTPPAAVFSQNGELLLHNTNFLKLKILPNECMKFNDGDKIERERSVYLVNRINIDLEYEKNQYFVFTNELQTSSVRNISAQELGIISSSVAHELNNPLAGIIAAVSLLQLEENISAEDLLDLSEMKQGAQRCKQLVEIFLGFSKKNIGGQTSTIFEDALDRALNLLRFRMVESNVRVEVSIAKTLETFGREMNVSVVSMIFYLIFSEIITQVSHHRLVADPDIHFDNMVKGVLTSYGDRVELMFEASLSLESVINKATLITNLTQIEGLTLNVSSNRIVLS